MQSVSFGICSCLVILTLGLPDGQQVCFGFSQYLAFASRTSGVQILPNRLIRQIFRNAVIPFMLLPYHLEKQQCFSYSLIPRASDSIYTGKTHSVSNEHTLIPRLA